MVAQIEGRAIRVEGNKLNLPEIMKAELIRFSSVFKWGVIRELKDSNIYLFLKRGSQIMGSSLAKMNLSHPWLIHMKPC